MKIAKVIPPFKAGNKHHFTNYRPVSLLTKLLNKNLFNNRLNIFLENLKIINQYESRSDRSILAIIEAIYCRQVIWYGGIIDEEKSFGTIKHEIVIRKIE